MTLPIRVPLCASLLVGAIGIEGSARAEVAPSLQATDSIVRLAPDSFSTLPPVVRADLNRRGCTVPQTSIFKGRENVISGAFIRRGQTDWAVLCSIHLVSRVLVYRAGRTEVVDSLEPLPDADFVDHDNGRVVYERLISRADSSYIAEHAKEYQGFLPDPLDHVGIDDAFIDKGSSVHYFFKGEWLKLAGAN